MSSEKDTRKMEGVLNVLSQFSQIVNDTSKETITKLEDMLNAVGSVVTFDAAQILFLNEDDRAVSIVSHGYDPMARSLEYDIGQGAIGTSIKTGKTYFTGDLQVNGWNEPIQAAYTDIGFHKTMKSVLVAPLRVADRQLGAIEILSKRENWFSEIDVEILGQFLMPLSLFVENAKQQHNHKLEILAGIYNQLEAKHEEYKGHAQQVQEISLMLYDALGAKFSEPGVISFRDRLKRAAALHDIGKIRFQDDELDRKEVFKDPRQNIFRDHPVRGYNIAKETGTTDQVLLDGILHHHQDYDGNGYPYVNQGARIAPLEGENIPVVARIIHSADVFSALISDRPYRSAYSTDAAIAMMKEKKEANRFDPRIFQVFLQLHSQGKL